MKRLLGTLCCLLFFSCSGEAPEPAPVYLDREALMDPETCKECHEAHYTEWSGSMHAYASVDPVFLAMNARGQRETNGELGDFCVQCHAPMALKLGLTTDGLNLPELPDYVQGITCYFCHSVEAVEGTHNAPLRLADDGVMRGGYANPVPNTAHASAYSSLLDREHIDSASLCGSCHDIVTPRGVHIERTFAEWKDSLFAHEVPDEQQTCGNCHMKGRDDVAAQAPGVFLRRVHDHRMPGVDVALDPFPQMEDQLAQVQAELNKTVIGQVCVSKMESETSDTPQNMLTVVLENLGAGHSWPSGATQDRRAWVELIAYDGDGKVLFESGVLEEGVPLRSLEDPNLWEISQRGLDENGDIAHMFWDITESVGELLPAPTARSPLDPEFVDTHIARQYLYTGTAPELVTLRVRIRPMGLDLLQDLVDSGDLDPKYLDRIPTFNLAFSQVEWRADAEQVCIP